MKPSDDFRVIQPDPKVHAEAIFDLTGKVFGNYWGWVANCRRKFIEGRRRDWSATTIGLIGDEVVSHWGITGYTMRIGACAVRVAGVGDVATRGDLRKKGYMARTAAAGVQASRRVGYDLSMLFGIWNFYHRFGFVRAWPGQRYVAAVDHLPTEPPQVKPRKMTQPDTERLTRLYNRYHAGLTGTAVRGRDSLWEQPGGLIWSDSSGRPAGYVFAPVGHDGVDFIDAAGPAEQVLRVLAQLARQHKVREVRLPSLHYDSELARLLRRGACRLEIQYAKSGGAMIRTLNLASTLGKIAPELSRRLRESHLAGWRGELLVADASEKAVLRIDRGKVAAAAPSARRVANAIRGGREIAQLLIGCDEPGELAEAGRMRLTGQAAALMEVLFPAQHPMLSLADMY